MSSKVQRIMVQPIVSDPTLQEHPTNTSMEVIVVGHAGTAVYYLLRRRQR
jgi:hypothetical protein